MNRTVKALVCGLAITALASGCGPQRRWGMCALGGGLLGGTLGAVGGGVGVDQVENGPDNGERAAGAAAGLVAGGVIGTILGHYICDPVVEEPVVQAPPPAPPPSGTQIVELKGTHFAFDSAKLTPTGESMLDHGVDVMNQNPSINVRIEGNTDSIGSDAYNMRLGQRRADSVQAYLVSKGISSSRLTTVSFGETRPVASNDTEEGRAQNRRVDLIVE